MPIDPRAPKAGDAPKYHIKGDPLGRACFPKPKPEPIQIAPANCECGWQDCTFCGGDGW